MISQRQTQQVMYHLRCAAERDPNDIIANAASQLAFELETPERVNRLTDRDRDLIRYSVRKGYTPLKSGVDKTEFIV
jgi:hypothetical protein